MRHEHKNHQARPRRPLLAALSILSHLAAILGTIVAILDTLHHW
ncbi:MAG TPA: hypothetical protein VIV34_12235 [Pseudolabrys sp.]